MLPPPQPPPNCCFSEDQPSPYDKPWPPPHQFQAPLPSANSVKSYQFKTFRMDLIPAAFLFRFALPIPFVPDLPHKTGGPCGDVLQPIPLFSDLDQPDQPVQIAL